MVDQRYLPEKYPDIKSSAKPFKRSINQAVLFILGRSLQSLSKHDGAIQEEVCTWSDDLTLLMKVLPDCGAMAAQRTSEGKLIYLGKDPDENQADIIIYIKNVEAAFQMLTGQMGTDVAYARHCGVFIGQRLAGMQRLGFQQRRQSKLLDWMRL